MSHVSSLDAGAQTVPDIELRLRSRYTRDKPPLKAKAPVQSTARSELSLARTNVVSLADLTSRTSHAPFVESKTLH
jgi:hypothetical protein